MAYWVAGSARSSCPVPTNAVFAGNDSDGSAMYIGRISHMGDLLPAKIVPRRNVAYVCYHGKEFLHYNYEVLCCDDESLRWEPSSLGRFHANAIPGGRTAVGETLYIGRAWHNGALTPGKIHSSHKVVYIPYGGLEFGKDTYEILVSQPQPQHQPQPQPQPRNEEVFYNEPAIVERVETTSSQHNEDDSFEMISSENENFPRENYAQCKICLSNEVGVVFTPCGHLLCCVDCASRLTTCPLCRHHIAGRVRTYLS